MSGCLIVWDEKEEEDCERGEKSERKRGFE